MTRVSSSRFLSGPAPRAAARRDTLSAQHKVLHAGARLPTAPRRTMPPKDRYTCAPGKTNRPTTEQLLHLLLAGLFSERLVPEGSVIDVGANDGEMACYYASLDPQRTVHAMEAGRGHYDHLVERYRTVGNMKVTHGAIGSEDIAQDSKQNPGVTGVYDGQKMPVWQKRKLAYPVYRIDTLFSPAGLFGGERLGFWHIDIEGHELLALRGATATLARDRPLIAAEVFVHVNHSYTAALHAMFVSVGYAAYIVDEACGGFDCRNLLCVPQEMVPKLMASSNSFNLALVSGAILETHTASDLFRLTADTIPKFNASCTYQHHFGSPIRNPVQRGNWAQLTPEHPQGRYSQ